MTNKTTKIQSVSTLNTPFLTCQYFWKTKCGFYEVYSKQSLAYFRDESFRGGDFLSLLGDLDLCLSGDLACFDDLLGDFDRDLLDLLLGDRDLDRLEDPLGDLDLFCCLFGDLDLLWDAFGDFDLDLVDNCLGDLDRDFSAFKGDFDRDFLVLPLE